MPRALKKAEIRTEVDVPVIAAGRMASGAFADRAIAEGKTDLIGLARVLWADPQWPKKVREDREADILHCNPDCGDAWHADGHERTADLLCGVAGGEDEGVECKIYIKVISKPR